MTTRNCGECNGTGKVDVQDYRTSAPRQKQQEPKPNDHGHSLIPAFIGMMSATAVIIGGIVYGSHSCMAFRREELAHQAYVVGYSDMRGKQHCLMVDAIDPNYSGITSPKLPTTSANFQYTYALIKDRNNPEDVLHAEQLLGITCNFKTGETIEPAFEPKWGSFH